MTKKLLLAIALFWLSISHAQMVLEYEIKTANTQIALPLYGTVNVSVNWGDGNTQTFTVSGVKLHTYSSIGIKTVTITGNLTHYGMGFGAIGVERLTKVKSWDGLGLTSFSYAFCGAKNLISVPTTLPITVTDLSYMFYDANSFNQPIGTWNTASVTNMSYMFSKADSFNQPIGNWDIGNVTDMSYMFGRDYMSTNEFSSFNQPIGNWNTKNVLNMEGVFYGAKLFNQPIGSWNTANVTNMYWMFSEANSFNQPIGSWNTTNVTSMDSMFAGASSFNQPIGSWNISKVQSVYCMFAGATSFNQNLDTWDISNKVSLSFMFANAKSFNQSLDSWNISKVSYLNGMFTGAGLCTDNYDATLKGWANQVVKLNISFDGGTSKYSSAGATARATLISKGWTIADGGLNNNPSNCIVTSVEDDLKSSNLYPNPVAQGEELFLGNNVASFRLINSQGNEIMSGEKVDKINTHTLPKGLYVIQINQDAQKLVVE